MQVSIDPIPGGEVRRRHYDRTQCRQREELEEREMKTAAEWDKWMDEPFVATNGKPRTWPELIHAVQRDALEAAAKLAESMADNASDIPNAIRDHLKP
jgi:hypothetical protein